MKPVALVLAALSALTLAACSPAVEGTYCLSNDAGKLVFKDGKVTTDKGDAAGTYAVSHNIVTVTDPVGLKIDYTREKDGSLSSQTQNQLARCK